MLDSRINFVIGTGREEILLKHEIEVYCARYKELIITFTANPIPLDQASLYIIHVSRIRELSPIQGTTPVPVICYGPLSSLINAWHAGADDYLKEPWNASELHFRVGRILSGTHTCFTWHDIKADIYSISKDNISVQISYQEFRILRLLAAHEGAPVPRESLYYAIWGQPGADSRVVDVHISSLRKKLSRLLRGKAEGGGVLISSIRGEGYSMSWKTCGYTVDK